LTGRLLAKKNDTCSIAASFVDNVLILMPHSDAQSQHLLTILNTVSSLDGGFFEFSLAVFTRFLHLSSPGYQHFYFSISPFIY